MRNESGFTIIELVITITVMGFVLASLTKMFTDFSVASVEPEYRHIQSMMAEDIMEEIRSKRFDELTELNSNSNWSETLGVDSGETATNRATFDDVDDYAGYSETVDGYTRTVSVAYVNPGVDINAAVSPPNPVTTNGWTQDLKLVTVQVSNAGIATTFTLHSIMSSARSRDVVY